MQITDLRIGDSFTDVSIADYAALSATQRRKLPLYRLTEVKPGEAHAERVHVTVETGDHIKRQWCVPAIAPVTVLDVLLDGTKSSGRGELKRRARVVAA